MLSTLAAQYYSEEDVSEGLRLQIAECLKRAKNIIGAKAMSIIESNYEFHDWYIKSFYIQSVRHDHFCEILLYNHVKCYNMIFENVHSIVNIGNLVTPLANYPKTISDPSFAQVLDVWFDYHGILECCLLLDSQRYIIIETKKIHFRE